MAEGLQRGAVEGSRRQKPEIVQGKSYALCSKVAWLTEQQYGQTVPPTDRFGTVTTWLSSKTNEDTLENTTPLSEYFPNGPLGQIYAIDIVAVAEKPFRFFVQRIQWVPSIWYGVGCFLVARGSWTGMVQLTPTKGP